jgi:hypothetical protein
VQYATLRPRAGVKKLEEIEGRIAEAKRMRAILRKLIERPSLEACTEALARAGSRRPSARNPG